MSNADDFLAHYGVKGMKWGRRGLHADYTENQVKRDSQVYGKRGAKRINNQLHDGASISVARGDEKTRRDNVMSKSKYVRQGGKVGAALGGVAAANLALSGVKKLSQSSVGRRAVSEMFSPQHAEAFSAFGNLATSPVVRVAASAGAAKVASMMAGDIAVNTRLRAHGYNPNRK